MQVKRIADLLRALGEDNSPSDSILAHITPEEAALLKRRGGSGRIDPMTGLPHFEDSGSDEGFSGYSSGSEAEGAQEGFSGPSLSDAPAGPDQNPDGSFNPNAFQNVQDQWSWQDPNTGQWSYDIGGMLGFGPSQGNPNFDSYSAGRVDPAYDPTRGLQKMQEEWERQGLTEQEISSRQGLEGRLGDTKEANQEYQALSALGNFDGWGIQNIGGGTSINWGGIANDVIGALNSGPGMAIGSLLMGPEYSLAAKSADIAKNAIAENILGRGYDQTTKSALNSLGTVGGYFGGPAGALLGGIGGQLAQGNIGNVLAGGISAGLNYGGYGLGGQLAGRSSNALASKGLGFIGQTIQDKAIAEALTAAGVPATMNLAGAASGYSFTGDGQSSTDSQASPMSVSGSAPESANIAAYGSSNYYSPQSFGGGGMDVGSVYLQKIKDLYKNQTDAFEQQRRKTWYNDGTWEVVK